MQDPRGAGLSEAERPVAARDYQKVVPARTYSSFVADDDPDQVAHYLRHADLLNTITPNEAIRRGRRRRQQRMSGQANRRLARARGLA